jgi:hypothetical protein
MASTTSLEPYHQQWHFAERALFLDSRQSECKTENDNEFLLERHLQIEDKSGNEDKDNNFRDKIKGRYQLPSK